MFLLVLVGFATSGSCPPQCHPSPCFGVYLGTNAAGGYAMTVGSALWDTPSNDYDIVVLRTIATDELFASGFGTFGVE